MKFIFYLSLFVFASCSVPELTTTSFNSEFGVLEILSIENKNNESAVLLILDDDTVSQKQQIESIYNIYNGRRTIYAFPKMDYKDIVRKNNTDSPKLRLENLVHGYLHLVTTEKIKPTTQITVLGIGEGSILAPHFHINIHANNLVLINPFYISLGENFVLNMTEKSASTKKIETNLRFNSDNDWLTFINNAQNKNLPDKIVGTKSMRFYSEYWNINPSEYLELIQTPIQYIVFEDFMYTSIYNKKKIIEQTKKQNIEVIELPGDMFSKFSIEQLKRLNLL